MLFNIAQAYRLAGESKLALDYYQLPGAVPNSAGVAEARERRGADVLDVTRPPVECRNPPSKAKDPKR
jgi:hypothetical protein